jgi:hypothetical protein
MEKRKKKRQEGRENKRRIDRQASMKYVGVRRK